MFTATMREVLDAGASLLRRCEFPSSVRVCLVGASLPRRCEFASSVRVCLVGASLPRRCELLQQRLRGHRLVVVLQLLQQRLRGHAVASMLRLLGHALASMLRLLSHALASMLRLLGHALGVRLHARASCRGPPRGCATSASASGRQYRPASYSQAESMVLIT